MRILVTGANGFVGRAIVGAGAREGHTMLAASRKGEAVGGAAKVIATGDMANPHFAPDFAGAEAVINCAARVHVTAREKPRQAAAAYEITNAAMPFALASAAREAGVRRFVQLSSVAAIASTTPDGATFTDATPPAPTTPYGEAKLAADRALADLARGGFSVVSLRPPAIYGPGVGAWFAKLMRAARAGTPLPIGAIRNRRSFAFVENVADAAICAATCSDDRIQNGAFIVTDSSAVSVAWLYRQMLAHYGFGDRAWRWPPALIRLPAQLFLRGRAESLLGNAAFDGSRFAEAFGWQPRCSMDEALRLTLTGN